VEAASKKKRASFLKARSLRKRRFRKRLRKRRFRKRLRNLKPSEKL
jgi:hypothetical protein